MMIGIIPARFASTRFPGKPLIDIRGKSMIQRVYEQAIQAKDLRQVIVATDDQRILDHVLGFGGNAIKTDENHCSGTDRCQEVMENTEGDFQFVVNIQGDEPFILPQQIRQVLKALKDPGTGIATLKKQINTKC